MILFRRFINFGEKTSLYKTISTDNCKSFFQNERRVKFLTQKKDKRTRRTKGLNMRGVNKEPKRSQFQPNTFTNALSYFSCLLVMVLPLYNVISKTYINQMDNCKLKMEDIMSSLS